MIKTDFRRKSRQRIKAKLAGDWQVVKAASRATAVTQLSFTEFVNKANPRYKWYPHVKQLAQVLQRVADGEISRLMVFMPPRHGKSELVSRLFSAYYLYRYPERWVGINSYAAELAYTFSRNARENYTRLGGLMKDGATAVKHWETGSGGGLWAAGVGGPITGKGFHLGVIDDPIKNAEEAASETVRAKQKDWLDSTFSTREEPDAAIIVIQTRWHEDDISGYLLQKEQDEPDHWHIVHLEAIKEEDTPKYPSTCTMEPDGREAGEPLAPMRYSLEKLNKIAKRIGKYFWDALYQQNPMPKAGTQFKREWFSHFVDALPVGCDRVRYWDKAGADENKGDYTVGALLARDSNGYYYVEDIVRGQWQADERNSIIRQTAELDRQNANIHHYREPDIWVEQPPGLGKESTVAVIRLLAGFHAQANPVNKDKVERAEPFKAQCQAGNVRLKRGHWNKDLIDELCAFPYEKHDDQVDGCSGAFNKLSEKILGGGFTSSRYA